MTAFQLSIDLLNPSGLRFRSWLRKSLRFDPPGPPSIDEPARTLALIVARRVQDPVKLGDSEQLSKSTRDVD